MSNGISVQGRGYQFIGAAFLISFIALVVPLVLLKTGTNLPFKNVVGIWGVVALMDMGLFLVAASFASRRLILKEDRLHVTSWFSQRSWHVAEITNITCQEDTDRTGDHIHTSHYLAFWSASKLLGRVNTIGWPRENLAHLLQQLTQANPHVQVSPEAQKFF